MLHHGFGEEPRRERRQASTPVDRADRGNQPIHRRVDTISKQYQVEQCRVAGPVRETGRDGGTHGSRTQDGNGGGGAPWES